MFSYIIILFLLMQIAHIWLLYFSLEEVPELYPVQEFGDRKSLENLSTNIISTENGLNFKESSGLEQVSGQLDNQSPDTPVSSVSQDKFNFGSPNQVGLPSPEIGN